MEKIVITPSVYCVGISTIDPIYSLKWGLFSAPQILALNWCNFSNAENAEQMEKTVTYRLRF